MYEQSACRRVLVGQLGHRECSDVTAPDLLSRIVKLALLAQLFCILAASVPCKTRLLSSAAYVNKERSSLSGENMTIKHLFTVNPLKHSSVRWLHFQVFSAVQD